MTIKLLTYLIAKFKYFLIFFFIKRSIPKKKEHILLLCTGLSLLNSKKYIQQCNNIDLIILVNFEKTDLLDSKLKDLIKNIPIITLYNITEKIMDLKCAYGLTFYENYIQRFNPREFYNSKKDSAIFSHRTVYWYNSISNKIKYLPKQLYKYVHYIQKKNPEAKFNSGLIAMLLACYYSPKKVTIFGLDFYSTDYFNKKNFSNKEIEFQDCLALQKGFIKTFFAIICTFNSVKFKIFSYYKFKLKKNNLIIIKL